MDEILALTFRTVVLYFIIFILFRLMGKREIGELSILDLVVFIMMAEIAVLAIENLDDHLLPYDHSNSRFDADPGYICISVIEKSKNPPASDGKPTIIITAEKLMNTP